MTTYRLVALIPFLAAMLGFQGPSMRELAKSRGKSIQNVQNEYLYPPGLDELTAKADAIVEGRIVSLSTHLASDESVVMTKYSVQPIWFLKASGVEARSTPGPSGPIVVERVGGTMQEGEYTYTTLVSTYPQAAELKVGEEVIAFLSQSRDGAYEFAGAFFGVFRIAGDEVRPMFPNDSAQRKSIPVRSQDFFVEVNRRLARR